MSKPPEPSRTEAVTLLAITFLVQILEAHRLTGWRLRASGALDNIDNGAYLQLADLIRRWQPVRSFEDHHFWGYPYFIAGVSTILRLSPVDSMILLSMAGAVVTCLLVHRLYGGRVAVALGMVSSSWIMLSVFGGCEPLFVALVFGSIFLAREERWTAAALLGVVASAVRPVGPILLFAVFACMLGRRQWRSAVRAAAVVAVAAALYVIPLYLLTGDALVQLKMYSTVWKKHTFPLANAGLLTFPGLRLAQSFFYLRETRWKLWTAAIQTLFWVLVALLGAVLMWMNARSKALPPVDRVFGCAYTGFVVCYNYDLIAMYIDRFLLPVLPLILYGVRQWIPVRRRILWPLYAASIVVNTSLLFHFKSAFGFALPGITR